jgi:hypothetical protein
MDQKTAKLEKSSNHMQNENYHPRNQQPLSGQPLAPLRNGAHQKKCG